MYSNSDINQNQNQKSAAMIYVYRRNKRIFQAQ